MMGSEDFGGSDICIHGSSVGKYGMRFSGVQALSASCCDMYLGHSLFKLLCSLVLQLTQKKCVVRVAVGVAVFSSACSTGVLFLWTCFSHVAPTLTLEAAYRFPFVLSGAEPVMVKV